ncbi:MAG TPA: aminotransferase class I/II-fold pyridoxal phosphate-dependent enzyme [Gemmatimonadales bacterium]|nr:aminotransferase class I/II-fold pyridoxal phosphate-dependent enzyme [Gemmatimonadales bacterium]
MSLPPFALERWFARWEFVAPHLLGTSDVEAWRLADLLALADPDARARWDALTLGYTEPAGLPALREAIAGLYADVAADEVLVTTGAEEAIYVLLRSLLAPGEHCVVTWPAYQSLHAVARAAGADVTLLPLRAEQGWVPTPEQLAAALRPATRLVVLNFPHNPTGALPDAATFRRLVEVARAQGAYVLSDEVYRLLEHDPADRLPAGVELPGRTISLGVMSKAFGLAGLRIGWLATHDREVLARVAGYKDYTTICASAPSEVLALAALRAREAVLARSRAIVAANLPLLDAFFERWAGVVEWVRPRAGCIGYPRLLLPTPVERFCEELVEREGVLLLPGTVFGDERNHFRIGFGRRTVAAGLEGLGRFLARATR